MLLTTTGNAGFVIWLPALLRDILLNRSPKSITLIEPDLADDYCDPSGSLSRSGPDWCERPTLPSNI